MEYSFLLLCKTLNLQVGLMYYRKQFSKHANIILVFKGTAAKRLYKIIQNVITNKCQSLDFSL